MKFKFPKIEGQFRGWEWARNNTIELAEAASKAGELQFTPIYKMKSCNEYNIAYQFMCVLATTSAYLAKIRGDKKAKFGIFRKDGKEIKQENIDPKDIVKFLREQLKEAEETIMSVEEKDYSDTSRYLAIMNNHENMHQGQLIVMFRSADIKFPDTFRRAWAL